MFSFWLPIFCKTFWSCIISVLKVSISNLSIRILDANYYVWPVKFITSVSLSLNFFCCFSRSSSTMVNKSLVCYRSAYISNKMISYNLSFWRVDSATIFYLFNWLFWWLFFFFSASNYFFKTQTEFSSYSLSSVRTSSSCLTFSSSSCNICESFSSSYTVGAVLWFKLDSDYLGVLRFLLDFYSNMGSR